MRTFMKNTVTTYFIILAVLAGTMLFRWLLDPWLGNSMVVITPLAAVIVAVWMAGYRAGLLVLILGYVLSDFLFIDPRGIVTLTDPVNRSRQIAYFFVGLSIIAIGELMRQAQLKTKGDYQFLQVTLASIGDAVITTDNHGKVSYLNAVAESLTGWTMQEAIGRPLGEIFHILSEQTRQVISHPVVNDLTEDKIVWHAILVSRNGTEWPIENSTARIKDDTGEFAGVVHVFRDISERRRVEAEDRFLADLAVATQSLLDPAKVVEEYCQLLARYLSVERCIYARVDDESVMVISSAAEEYAGMGVAGRWPGALGARCTHELLNGKPYVVPDVEMDIGVDLRELPVVLADTRSLIYTPFHKDGKLVAVMGIFHTEPRPWRQEQVELVRTVTERCGKALELAETNQKLRESETMKAAMINTSLDGIITMDHDGKIIEFNPAAESMFGYRRSYALGKELAALIIPPALRESHRQGVIRFRKTRESSMLNRRLELMAMRADGSTIPVELTISEIESGGHFTGYIRDITARKEREAALLESEENFRSMADNITQLAWMADENGNTFWYNRRWFDYTSATLDQILDKGWQMFQHPDHKERVMRRLQYCIDTGEYWEDIFPLLGRNNKYRWFLARAVPIRSANGDIIRWFGTNTDIHEQRELQEKLQKLATQLSVADRYKDEFLAILAHELRNPLAPVRNSLEIMKLHTNDDPVMEQARTTMDRQVGHMERLIDDLLDISRITRNQIGRAHV